MTRVFSLVLLSTLAGCGGPHPEPAELYGMWMNVDDTSTVRVLEFAATDDDPELVGLTDVYHIYNYPQGSAAIEVMRGTFVIAEGDGWEVVTTDLWDPDSLYIGQSFGNPINAFEAGSILTLALDDGSEREYTATATMP